MFTLSMERIDAAALKRELENASSGACVTFEGWVRDNNDGRRVVRLEYEAYPEVAFPTGEAILREAIEKFGLSAARCVHRIGVLQIGEAAVWIGVSAGHRAEAFEACRYIIDEIKKRVPIWKKEHFEDGDSGWVNCNTGEEEKRHG